MPFPNMSDAFADWQDCVEFSIIKKEIVDFEIKETARADNFYGLFYPLQPQQIILKPEGQRTWKWWTLISQKELKLDDIIIDRNKVEYRIMAINNYSQAGFYQYDLTENYINGQSCS